MADKRPHPDAGVAKRIPSYSNHCHIGRPQPPFFFFFFF